MKKVSLFVIINSLTINSLQSEEMVLKPIDILKERKNPLLNASIDKVIKAKNPDLHYQKASFQYIYCFLLQFLLENFILNLILKLIFNKNWQDIEIIILNKQSVNFFGKPYKEKSLKIIKQIIKIIISIPSFIYIYNISKNKLFNLINTWMICLFLTNLILEILYLFMNSKFLQDRNDPSYSKNLKNDLDSIKLFQENQHDFLEKNPNFFTNLNSYKFCKSHKNIIILLIIIYIIYISLFIISIVGIIKKFKIDNEYKNEIKLYEEKIKAEYNQLKESNKDNNSLNSNLTQHNN
jgi:hypothetical protein